MSLLVGSPLIYPYCKEDFEGDTIILALRVRSKEVKHRFKIPLCLPYTFPGLSPACSSFELGDVQILLPVQAYSKLGDRERSLFKSLLLLVEPEYKEGKSKLSNFSRIPFPSSRCKMPTKEQRTQ